MTVLNGSFLKKVLQQTDQSLVETEKTQTPKNVKKLRSVFLVFQIILNDL